MAERNLIPGEKLEKYPRKNRKENIMPEGSRRQMIETNEFRSVVRKRSPIWHFITESLVRGYVGLEVDGRENLVKANELMLNGKVVIFATNHLSHSDFPVLDHAMRMNKFHSMADKIRVLQGGRVDGNPLILGYNCVPIPSPHDKAKESEQKQRDYDKLHGAIETIEHDFRKQIPDPLMYSPEGGRSRVASLVKVNPESSLWATLVPGTYVCPTGIVGTEKIMPPGKIIPEFNWAKITFGELISIDELSLEELSTSEKNIKVTNVIMHAIAKLLPEEYRGYYGKN